MSLVRDLHGARYGRLLVMSQAASRAGYARWNCRCDCGCEKIVVGSHLVTGRVVSCGCYRNEKIAEVGRGHRKPPREPKPRVDRFDITAHSFGRLTVLERAGVRGRASVWRCACECGSIAVVAHAKLTGGHTKSCGCLNREGSRARAKVNLAGKRGADHPRWDDQLTEADRKYARQPEHQAWSKVVLRNDGWKCVPCGRGGRVQAHHLRSYRLHPDVRFDPSNGITVCPGCHRAYHSHVGRADFTAESFFRFFGLMREIAA